jgi:hypothetical protein
VTDTYVFENLSGLKKRCTRVTVLNKRGEQLWHVLEPRYRKFLSCKVAFARDFDGIRGVDDMPQWKRLLES